MRSTRREPACWAFPRAGISQQRSPPISTSSAYPARDAVDHESARPAFAALVYPLITMSQPFGRAFARQMLLGDKASADQAAARSPERRVTSRTPPSFLAHAIDDRTVDVANSFAMLEALRARRIEVEAHFFARGDHAFGIGRQGEPSGLWPELLLAWARGLSA
nr:prolyl oligopeptidase family serine peptidase [Sphingopyxis sp. PET50]